MRHITTLSAIGDFVERVASASRQISDPSQAEVECYVMNPKGVLLKQNGYRYNFDRMIYLNLAAKKVFSVAAIEDNPVDWLTAKMAEQTDGDWQFYFNEPPPPAVVR